MPQLDAEADGGNEVDVSEVRRLWEWGKVDEFKAAAYKAKLNLWQDDIVYYWIAYGPHSHQKRSEEYENVTMHYELMRILLDASIVSNSSFWDEDQMKRWIDMLVEHKYPWFVCKSWNHLTPLAISFLHESSLFHHHSSNLHKLLHQRLIQNLWEASDFMSSMTDQYSFFKQRPTGKRGAAWRRELNSQFQYYPYDNVEYVKTTLKALVLSNQFSLLKTFVQYEQSNAVWYKADLVVTCIQYERPKMVEWVLEEHRFIPTVHEWYTFACTIHPYHLEMKLHRDFRSPTKHNMLSILLHQFDDMMSPADWIHLFTHSVNGHTFVQLLVLSYRGEELLDFVWERVVSAVRQSSFPIEFELHETNREVCITSDMANEPKTLFRYFEQQIKSDNGWTVTANAMRWGTQEVVMWLREHGSEFMFKCTTRGIRQNALSLACYNSNNGVLNYLLQEFSRFIVQPWLITGIDDLVYALTRHSLRHDASYARFDKILNLCTHNSLAFKTCIVNTVTRRMEELADQVGTLQTRETEDGSQGTSQLDEDRHASRNSGPVAVSLVAFCQTMGPGPTPKRCYRPLLKRAFEIPGQMESTPCVPILSSCTTLSQFRRIYTELIESYGMVHLAMLYHSLLVKAGMTTEHAIPWTFIQCVEKCPQFVHEMRHCYDIQLRRWITLMWSKQSSNLFRTYLQRARCEWGWFLTDSLMTYDSMALSYEQLSDDKWRSLLTYGQYPLVSPIHDEVYHRLAKAYRFLRRRVRAYAKWKRRAWAHYQTRVHLELECRPSNQARIDQLMKSILV